MNYSSRVGPVSSILVVVSVSVALLFLACRRDVETIVTTPRPVVTTGPVPPVAAAQTPTGEMRLRGGSPQPSDADQRPDQLPSAAVGCRLVDGGTISGSVTYAGKPVPDGSYVFIVFEGGEGLSTHIVTGGGRYSLRTSARACAGTKRWSGFTIRSGGARRNVGPTQPTTVLDLRATALPAAPSMLAQQGAPVPPSNCDLVLGTLSGVVSVGGAPAADGTVVVGVPGPDPRGHVKALPIAQTVFTKDGKY